jgi:hypothetical protein
MNIVDLRDQLVMEGPSREIDALLAYFLLSQPMSGVHASYGMRQMRTNLSRPLCMQVNKWVAGKADNRDICIQIDGCKIMFIESVVPHFTTNIEVARQLSKDVFSKPCFVSMGDHEDGAARAQIRFHGDADFQRATGLNSNFASALIGAILNMLIMRDDIHADPERFSFLGLNHRQENTVEA